MASRRTFLSGATAAAAASLSRAQTSRLRVGLIGPGGRGKALMRQVVESGLADLAAVADVFLLRHQEAREIAPAVRTYLDHREMLAREDLDAVIIATPLHRHAEPFIDAVEAGAHVYIEKTLAYDLKHAKAMRAARNRFPNQVVQVGIQSLSSGAAQDVPLMLADGKVGQVTEIRAGWYRNSTEENPPWVWPIPPQAQPANVDWPAFLGDRPPVGFDSRRLINWRLFLDYSGGAVTELMVHQLGFWTKMLDLGVPDRVVSSGDNYKWKDGREVPDVWSVSMHFDAASLAFHWTSTFANRFLGIREHAFGTNGTIEKGAMNGVTARYIPESATNPNGVETAGQSPGSSHMDDFFLAIRNGREPACPFEVGFSTAVACRMAVDSWREQRTLLWDAKTETITPSPPCDPRTPFRSRGRVSG